MGSSLSEGVPAFEREVRRSGVGAGFDLVRASLVRALFVRPVSDARRRRILDLLDMVLYTLPKVKLGRKKKDENLHIVKYECVSLTSS